MPDMKTLFPSLSLIPVVVIDDAAHAVLLAEALLEGGIDAIEITLRTPAGLAAIESIAKALPQIRLGSGTVLSPAQLRDAMNAGAQFHVSPGITPSLAEAACKSGALWLAGTANASDVMLALEYGFDHVKLFPAGIAGGTKMLSQLASVFSQVKICPTGGVSLENLSEYAAQKNVFAIGGSWLAPKALMQQGDWASITQIARQSAEALAAAACKR